MRVFTLAGVLVVLSSCGSQLPAAAPQSGQRLDVVGVHYGDGFRTAEATLKAASFKPDPGTIYSDHCDRTFEEVVSAKAKISYEPTGCHQRWIDQANRQVMLVGSIHPDGFRVSTVEYTMPYNGSNAQLAGELRRKFGEPKGSFRSSNGPIPTFSSGADVAKKVFLRGGTNENTASITLEPNPSYRDAMEADKLVAGAVARKSGGAALKL